MRALTMGFAVNPYFSGIPNVGVYIAFSGMGLYHLLWGALSSNGLFSCQSWPIVFPPGLITVGDRHTLSHLDDPSHEVLFRILGGQSNSTYLSMTFKVQKGGRVLKRIYQDNVFVTGVGGYYDYSGIALKVDLVDHPNGVQAFTLYRQLTDRGIGTRI
jgi:hypothetical protein